MRVESNKLKIASFSTKEQLWDDFVAATEKNGATVTDVLGALMEQYVAGKHPPLFRTNVDAKAARLNSRLADRSKLPESMPSQAESTSDQPLVNDTNLTGIHVLVLDDEINVRTAIATILEHYGATVTAIASAPIALKTLQANPQAYNVLLSDIGMPEQDGWSFIRQVRALSAEAGGKIPAAALTTYASSREIDIARQLGFQVHIAKPIDANLLASIVAKLARN